MGQHRYRNAPRTQSTKAPRPSSGAAALLDRALDTGVRCQNAGQMEEAKQIYIRILEQQPNHNGALHNLSIIAVSAGDVHLAVELAQRAATLSPVSAKLRSGLGFALEAAGLHERAELEFQTALRLDPNCVDALCCRGTALRAKGLLKEAIVSYQRAITLDPHHLFARNNLGEAYLTCGKLEEAAASFRLSLEEQPNGFMAVANLGIVLQLQGDLDAAEGYLQKAMEMEPNNAFLHANLCQNRMLAKRYGEAIAGIQDALRFAPDVAELHVLIGRAYAVQGRLDDALSSYRQALALQPKFPIFHSVALFMFHYSPDWDAPALAAEHRIWGERFADHLGRPGYRHANQPDPARKLRVGYVSADFRLHPIGFFMDAVLASHDRNAFDIVCYSSGQPDPWTERLRVNVPLWRTINGLGDGELAQLIEQDRIDILIDLAGHTDGNRLLMFARKPAPVQVSWMGYFNTTGIRAMDYLIVDSQIAPLDEQAPFVEEALRIPGCYLAYQVPDYAGPVAPAPCIERGFVTYGCFNELSKVGTHAVPVFSEILRQNPTSRLVMRNRPFADEATRNLYQQHFERCGIEPGRLDLLGPCSHIEYFQSYAQVDITLDPFPYNGGTTTCESLAMGVPVVNLRGDRFVSRLGSTILHNAGLDDLITHSQAEYIEKAVELGRNPARLAEMRTNMRQKLAASTLFDTAGFTKKLESAYRGVWQHWCVQQSRTRQSPSSN